MEKIKCIKFPKIEQFRNVVSGILRQSNFIGLDDNGDAIYDSTKLKPTLVFKGSVKLHGTNAGVSYNDKFGLWTQSRNNAFTLDKHDSHMGFTFFVNSHRELFESFMKDIAEKNNIDTSKFCITIFGEWAGQRIQKNVAISMIEKSFFIFGVKVSNPDDVDFTSLWLDHSEIRSNENKIYNILDFPTFEIKIDFNMPQLVQNELGSITQKIEDECPVGKFFGHSGVGEGVVWSCDLNGVRYSFKVKGEKHAGGSNIKKLPKVDVGKLSKIHEVVNNVTPIWRLNQFLVEHFNLNNDGILDRKELGNYIRKVIKDVMDEEMDIIIKNDLTPKDINKYIGNICRDYFFEQEKKENGF